MANMRRKATDPNHIRVGLRLRVTEAWRQWAGTKGSSAKKPEEVFGRQAPAPVKAVPANDNTDSESEITEVGGSGSHAIPGVSFAKPPKNPGKAPAIATNPDRGLKNECKTLDARYTRKGELVLEPSSKPFDPQNEQRIDNSSMFDEYCLMITRHFDKQNRLEYTSLKIQSPYIVKALRHLVDYYPDNPVHVADVITIERTPALIYHYRHELAAYADDCTGENRQDTQLHIRYLLAYLRLQIGDEIDDCDAHLAQGLVKAGWLWMLFRPGLLAYDSDMDMLFHVKRSEYTTIGKCLCFSLECQYVSFDGNKVGRTSHTLTIPIFGGTRELSSLSVRPLDLVPEPEALQERLMQRGRKFLELRGVHSQLHSRFGRVVIDRSTFKERRFPTPSHQTLESQSEVETPSKCICPVCSHTVLEKPTDYDHPLRTLAPSELVLCSSVVSGFTLTSHKWAEFRIDDLSPVPWNISAIGSLVMAPKTKEVILSLITSPIFMNAQPTDVISWKSKGLVMLLHGPPGTGKTLTAEVVCEHLRRPLYIVNGGELGDTPESVERKLKDVLELSIRWNAIILIDEADVFLEARTARDIHRNSLVSVFLRQLEYFEGMLFLTTNRVGAFDDAFSSRIHLALRYPDLDDEQRREVWTNSLKQFPAEEVSVDYRGQGLTGVARAKLNGRVISYAVRTAKALAEGKGEKLGEAHLSDVVAIYEKFSIDSKNGRAAEREEGTVI